MRSTIIQILRTSADSCLPVGLEGLETFVSSSNPPDLAQTLQKALWAGWNPAADWQSASCSPCSFLLPSSVARLDAFSRLQRRVKASRRHERRERSRGEGYQLKQFPQQFIPTSRQHEGGLSRFHLPALGKADAAWFGSQRTSGALSSWLDQRLQTKNASLNRLR